MSAQTDHRDGSSSVPVRAGRAPVTDEDLGALAEVNRYRSAAGSESVSIEQVDDEVAWFEDAVANNGTVSPGVIAACLCGAYGSRSKHLEFLLQLAQDNAYRHSWTTGAICGLCLDGIGGAAPVARYSGVTSPRSPFLGSTAGRVRLIVHESCWRGAAALDADWWMHPTTSVGFNRWRRASLLAHLYGGTASAWNIYGIRDHRRDQYRMLSAPLKGRCGGCGRTVWHAVWDEFAGTTCSERCRGRSRRARAAEQSRPRTRACEVCETEFTPKRADAKFCAGACRQEAYRRRKAEAR